jgi:hypothetical protein
MLRGCSLLGAEAAVRIAICAPILNDWPSALILLGRLDEHVTAVPHHIDVLFVDDGSDELPAVLERRPSRIRQVSVLRLRRNLGHQRAIAIGLAHLHALGLYDAVVVMDGDGEDRPEDVSTLIERCGTLEWSKIVFAKRTRRTEGLGFRLGYAAFKLLHRALVGRPVEVGNFSVVPRSALSRLVSVSEMWNHYAASAYHARLPVDLVPLDRGLRIAGQPKMNSVALVVHGLSAISVYSDIVGVRLLAVIVLAIVTALIAVAGVVAVKLGTNLAIPGWATNTIGILLVTLLNLVVLGILMSLFTLRLRSEAGFLPLRDYRYFVMDERVWHSEA